MMVPTEAQQVKAQKDLEKVHENLLANIGVFARTRPGKEFIWHVLDICDIHGYPPDDRAGTDRFLGRREVGLALISLLEEVDPKLYPRLLLNKMEDNDG